MGKHRVRQAILRNEVNYLLENTPQTEITVHNEDRNLHHHFAHTTSLNPQDVLDVAGVADLQDFHMRSVDATAFEVTMYLHDGSSSVITAQPRTGAMHA